MPALLKNDPMRIKVLSSISEAYILVGGSTFLVTFGSVLTDMLQYIFTQLQTKAHASALRIIELAISHSPWEGCSILKNTIQQLLPVVVSELIPVLNETKAMSRANEIVLVQYLSLFARIRLQTPDIYSFFFTKPVPPNATVDMNKDNFYSILGGGIANFRASSTDLRDLTFYTLPFAAQRASAQLSSRESQLHAMQQSPRQLWIV